MNLKNVAAIASLLTLMGCMNDPGEEVLFFSDEKADSSNNSRFRASSQLLAIGDEQEVKYDGAGAWTGSCGDGMTSGAEQLEEYLIQRFPQIERIGGFDCRHIVGRPSKASVHSTGRALDVMIPLGYHNAANNDLGDPIANFLIANAQDLGVQYFIWDRTAWNASRARGKKERYYGGKHPHNDHLHVELSLAGSHGSSAWLEPGWQPFGFEDDSSEPPREPPTSPSGEAPVPLDEAPEEPAEDPPGEEAPTDPTLPELEPEEPKPEGCAPLSSEGGVLDAASGCLWLRGPANYWNHENEGHDDALAWTTPWRSGRHMSSAEWAIQISEAGYYEVEVYVHAKYARHAQARYVLRHGHTSTSIVAKLEGHAGWQTLGLYEFSQDQEQQLTLYDNSDQSVHREARIVADAIRLRRMVFDPADPVDPSDPDADPGAPSDPWQPSDSPEPDADAPAQLTGGCQQAPGGTPLPLSLLLLASVVCLQGQRRQGQSH